MITLKQQFHSANKFRLAITFHLGQRFVKDVGIDRERVEAAILRELVLGTFSS